MRRLTIDELHAALERAAEPGRSALMQAMSLDPRNKRTAQLLRARLAKIDSQGLHTALWILIAAPVATLLEYAGIEDDDDDELPDDFDFAELLESGGLAHCCEQWSPGVARITLEGMWDRDFITAERRDALIALLDDPDALRSTAPAPAAHPAADVEKPVVASCGDAERRRRVLEATDRAANETATPTTPAAPPVDAVRDGTPRSRASSTVRSRPLCRRRRPAQSWTA
ncbi:MAG TPA: hypothetical protein VK988_12140 [Acidimicrobiales bacterium]|nr:hypothetical protein [Acidimicrobiales bacterium]